MLFFEIEAQSANDAEGQKGLKGDGDESPIIHAHGAAGVISSTGKAGFERTFLQYIVVAAYEHSDEAQGQDVLVEILCFFDESHQADEDDGIHKDALPNAEEAGIESIAVDPHDS